MSRFSALLLIVFLSSLFVGCGACQRVSESRAQFLKEQATPSTSRGNQIVLQIPKGMIDRTLKATQRTLPNVSFRLPGLGNLGKYVGRLVLDPKDVSIDIDRTQAVRLGVTLDVGYNRRVLFGLKLEAEAPIKYNQTTGVMEIIVDHDLFKSVEPVVSDGATTRLAKMLRKELPQIARPLFPMSTVKNGAKRAISALSKNLYRIIRKQVLTPMGEMVRFRFKLPKLPIEKATLRSNRHGWAIGLRTALPGHGISKPLIAVPSSRIRVLVATEVLPSLGNWGMTTGALPKTFNRKGQATKDGEFVAALGWRKDPRPLQVKLWTRSPETAGICLYARAAGVPKVSLLRKQLKISFKQGKLEEVVGPPLINSAVALLGISKRTFDLTKKIALQNEVSLGTQSFRLKLQSASIDASVLQFDLLATARKSKKAGS